MFLSSLPLFRLLLYSASAPVYDPFVPFQSCRVSFWVVEREEEKTEREKREKRKKRKIYIFVFFIFALSYSPFDSNGERDLSRERKRYGEREKGKRARARERARRERERKREKTKREKAGRRVSGGENQKSKKNRVSSFSIFRCKKIKEEEKTDNFTHKQFPGLGFCRETNGERARVAERDISFQVLAFPFFLFISKKPSLSTLSLQKKLH